MFDGGVNLYEYVKGDSVNWVDLTGRNPITVRHVVVHILYHLGFEVSLDLVDDYEEPPWPPDDLDDPHQRDNWDFWCSDHPELCQTRHEETFPEDIYDEDQAWDYWCAIAPERCVCSP